jgi:hypothetical protein
MEGGQQFGGGQRSAGGFQQAQRGPTLEDACSVLGVISGLNFLRFLLGHLHHLRRQAFRHQLIRMVFTRDVLPWGRRHGRKVRLRLKVGGLTEGHSVTECGIVCPRAKRHGNLDLFKAFFFADQVISGLNFLRFLPSVTRRAATGAAPSL